jgi:hypothetical protein
VKKEEASRDRRVMTHKTLFIDLERNSDALPNAVNPTGTIVVGKFASAGGFYWMPTTGVIDVGSFTTGVSADGDTIVGGSPFPFGRPERRHLAARDGVAAPGLLSECRSLRRGPEPGERGQP